MSLLDDIIAAKERNLSGAGDEVPYSSGRTSIPGVPDPRLEAELLRQYLVKSGELLPTPDVRLDAELARQKRVMAGETSKQIAKPATAPAAKKPAQPVKKKSVSPAKVSNKRTVQPLRTSPTMTRPYSPGLNIPQLPAVQSEIIRANLEQESNQNQRSRMAQFLDNLRMSASEGMEEYQKNPLNPRAMKSVSKTINRTAKRSPGVAEISLNDLIGKLPEGSLARQKAIESLNALRASTESTKAGTKATETATGETISAGKRAQQTHDILMGREKRRDELIAAIPSGAGPKEKVFSMGFAQNNPEWMAMAHPELMNPQLLAEIQRGRSAASMLGAQQNYDRWKTEFEGDLSRDLSRTGAATNLALGLPYTPDPDKVTLFNLLRTGSPVNEFMSPSWPGRSESFMDSILGRKNLSNVNAYTRLLQTAFDRAAIQYNNVMKPNSGYTEEQKRMAEEDFIRTRDARDSALYQDQGYMPLNRNQ